MTIGIFGGIGCGKATAAATLSGLCGVA